MPHPLEAKLGKLRNRVRLLLVGYGLSRLVALGLAAVVVLGVADYLIRFQDPGIRLIFSLLLLGVLACASYRYLYLGLVARLRDVDLARRLQRRFPALGDELASAVEFLKQPEDEPTAGSVGLRRAVIARTTAESAPLDFAEVIELRPTLRAAIGAAAICLLAAILVVLDPLSSRIAVARLAWPLGRIAWPQKTHLKLIKRVERVAAGQAFELEVVDAFGAKLPAEVRIHYRFEEADGTVTEESRRMRFLGGAMVARRENVTRPFSYRVQGGDDYSQPWIAVELVEPPAVASAVIELTPPSYTGWPVEKGDKHLRALVGTRVEIRATATVPLRSVAVCLDTDRTIPGRVSRDGLRFTVPGGAASEFASEFVVEKSGAYWLELTDREGTTGGTADRREIQAIPDQPPTVSIERPEATVFVTSRASLPVRVAAKDDLALCRVALVVDGNENPGDGRPRAEFPLYDGPDRVEPNPQGGLGADTESGERQVIDYRWDLGDLELKPGTQLAFHATATDYRPQTGKSDPRRLIVITPEQLAERIAGRQGLILAELGRVLDMQRRSRHQVEKLQIRIKELRELSQIDVDHLRGAEMNQRQAARTLTSRTEGVPMHILGLLAELENNKVDNPDIRRRMQGLLDEIARLQREHVPIISRELTAAIKTAQVRLEERSSTDTQQRDTAGAASLATAAAHQEQVIVTLERMLDALAQWDNYRRFHPEISRLLRQQEELARRTTELGRRTLARELEDLPPNDVADLKIQGHEQLELARRLDRILHEMDKTSIQLVDSDPLAAETVSDALERAHELAVSGSMQGAADHTVQNRIGLANRLHKQIQDDLQEILDILANRREHELARLVGKLRQARSELAELDRRQEGLHKRIRQSAADVPKTDAAKEAERRKKLQQLSQQQQKLQEQARRMARRLERLLADQAAKTTRQAANNMAQAGKCARSAAGKEAAAEAAEAKNKLDEALRQLDQRRRRAEAELAMEQLARLEDALQPLHRRQKKAIDETTRLDGLRQTQGRLTVPQTASLHELAQEQKLLQTEAAALGEKLTGAGVFELAISGAAGEMNRAARLLRRRNTGPSTQQAEQNALNRLAQVREALKPEQPKQPEQEPGGAGGQGQPGQTPGGGLRALAELKLLKILQQEIHLRTQKLEQTFGGLDKLDDEARRDYARLSHEQGRLAELMFELIETEANRR